MHFIFFLSYFIFQPYFKNLYINEEFNNVSSSIFVCVPSGCCMTASVRNISAQAIEVQNANLIIERVA